MCQEIKKQSQGFKWHVAMEQKKFAAPINNFHLQLLEEVAGFKTN